MAWALGNVVNAMGSGGEIAIWALENTKVNRMRKIRRVTVKLEIRI